MSKIATTLVGLTTATLTPQILQTLTALQIQIWSDRNENGRLAAMQELYHDNVSFFDHESVTTGIIQLNERISRLQQKNVGFAFSLNKIDNNNNVVRYYWSTALHPIPNLSPEWI